MIDISTLFVVIAVMGGFLLAGKLELKPLIQLIAAVAIFVFGLLAIGSEVWSTLPWLALVTLGLGLVLQRFVCPCGRQSCSHPRSIPLAMLLVLMIGHAFVEGHVLDELAHNHAGLHAHHELNDKGLMAMYAHKFFDGLALGIVLLGFSPSWRWAIVVVAAVATPLGAMFLPHDALGALYHSLLACFIIGVYAATAWGLAKSALGKQPVPDGV